LLVANNKVIKFYRLIGKQRLQCINVIGQLMQCNWHAQYCIKDTRLRPHKTLEKYKR